MPEDSLRIVGLKVATLIGVRDWERHVRQSITLDLELRIDASRAAQGDSISDAVDYGAVSRRVTALVAGSSVQLVETLAENVAAAVLREFAVNHVSVTVHKPGAVANATDVALTVQRARN